MCSGCEHVSPGLSPSRLSVYLRRILVLVGSSGACWMEPNVAFFPFLPSSFSTSKSTITNTWFNKQLNMTSQIVSATSDWCFGCKRKQHWPSEMLDSWNIVSKAWCVSAKDGRSKGFHLQPEGDKVIGIKKKKRIPMAWTACYHILLRWLWLLTGCHELIDLLGAALWSVHAVVFLQQLVHLRQVNARVGGHAVGGDLPQQNAKCWWCRRKKINCVTYGNQQKQKLASNAGTSGIQTYPRHQT